MSHQRASAAIIISEGTERAAAPAKFVIQLMHCGRVAHPVFTNGERPVAPSPVRPAGEVFTPGGMRAFVEPRELDTDKLATVRDQYVASARRAIAAGADGVELHAAHGYLLHQFLSTNTNRCQDGYGTDVAGRIRFVVETTQAVAAAIGPERVAVHTSPGHDFNDMHETGVRETYDALYRSLDGLELRYIHVLEAEPFAGYPTIAQARSSGTGR